MPFFVSTCKSQDADPLPPTTLCKAKNVSEYISEYVSEYTSKYVSEYTSEYISECTSECTSDYVREYISEYVSEYTSEYISEYISEKSSSPNSSHSKIGTHKGGAARFSAPPPFVGAAARGRRTYFGGILSEDGRGWEAILYIFQCSFLHLGRGGGSCYSLFAIGGEVMLFTLGGQK